MKTSFLNRKIAHFPSRGRTGMTLVEVVVALAITVFTVAGIVSGYIFCTTSSVKDSLYLAASTRAQERIEQTHTAQWVTSILGVPDQLTPSNFPPEVVTLDTSATGTNVVSATVNTYITPISSVPPVRRIHVDCIWSFNGETITTSIETCRASD